MRTRSGIALAERGISQVPTRSFCAWSALRPRQGGHGLA